ncbi:MAG: NAD(P)/FAD-dependent oxidoreductase, partial [Actinomycetaceae bacterium]
VVVADDYPNFSICGIPYYFTGEVQPWQSLAHRTSADLEATGMRLRLNTLATSIDVDGRRLEVRNPDGRLESIAYDELIVGTGALPSRAGIAGLDGLGPSDGVHVIHLMGDTIALDRDLAEREPRSAIIVGAGYVGLEMAEAFVARGMDVTQIQRGSEVLSTLDPELGAIVHDELDAHGVEVLVDTTATGIERTAGGLSVSGTRAGETMTRTADLVLVVVGVRPNTDLLERAGARLGAGGTDEVTSDDSAVDAAPSDGPNEAASADVVSGAETDSGDDEDAESGGLSWPWIAGGAVVVAGLVGGGVAVARRG